MLAARMTVANAIPILSTCSLLEVDVASPAMELKAWQRLRGRIAGEVFHGAKDMRGSAQSGALAGGSSPSRELFGKECTIVALGKRRRAVGRNHDGSPF